MYILLPDKNDIEGLVNKLQATAWSDILSNLKQGVEVIVRLPKFSIENKYDLSEALVSLGVEKAFQEGGKLLREGGLRVESLARIAALSVTDGVSFVED